MKKRMKSFLTLLVAVSLVLGCYVTSYAVSVTYKMTAYNEVIRHGKYAYCCTENGIYKVNVKTKSKKRIVNDEDFQINTPFGMKLYKGYLYYMTTGGVDSGLHRVRTNGKNYKDLQAVWDYAIVGGKIYYTGYDYKNHKSSGIKRVMDLNGKNVRKSSANVRNRFKESNKKGYSVKYTSKEIYLMMPNNKKVKLCNYSR